MKTPKIKLSSSNFRQTLIGMGFGVLFIGLFSLFFPLGSDNQSKYIFDSQSIHIAKAPEHEETEVVAQTEIQQPRSQLYKFFDNNKVTVSTSPNSIQLSVIISPLGKSKKVTKSMVETLPKAVTIGLTPYHTNPDTIETYDDYGFETWLQLSAITLNMGTDSGPLSLSPTYNFERNIELLEQQIGQNDKLTGIIMPSKALIVENTTLWQDMVNDLFAMGYGITDATSIMSKPAFYFYNDHRAPYIKADKTVYSAPSNDSLIKMLSDLEKSIQERKNYVLILPPMPATTLDILGDWLNSLGEKGITLVPLSAQAKL